MIHRLVSPAIYAAVVGATLLAPSANAQAGVIPWVYDAVFGPPRSAYSAYGYSANYRPSYTYYSPYRVGYAAPLSGWHRPAYGVAGYAAPNCSTCQSAACPGGNCGIATTANKPTPVEDEISKEAKKEAAAEDEKKTFVEGENGEKNPPGENSGFRAAQKPLTFDGNEPTDGDAEVEQRLDKLESTQEEILKTLLEIKASVNADDKEKDAEIERLKAEVKTLETAVKEKFKPAGTDEKKSDEKAPEGAKTDIDNKSNESGPTIPE